MPDSLLARVGAGDANAVRECLQRFGGLVWSLARRLSPSPSDAEDAVQEIFVDLWKSAKRFDPRAASEATFVAMIARRRLIDRLRSRRRRREDPLEEGAEASALAESPPGELAAEAALAAKALAQLRPEQRQVLLLATIHGLSHEEIAKRTGLPLGTVKTHARRGLLRVREVLATEGGRT
jgi:RNA polymerase sigma-70 factor (ECF subfamily)